MRSMITGYAVVALAILIAACSDPSGPHPFVVDEPASVPTFARHRPTVPVSVPDSVGIPASPPPIVEEAPPGFDEAQ